MNGSTWLLINTNVFYLLLCTRYHSLFMVSMYATASTVNGHSTCAAVEWFCACDLIVSGIGLCCIFQVIVFWAVCTSRTVKTF